MLLEQHYLCFYSSLMINVITQCDITQCDITQCESCHALSGVCLVHRWSCVLVLTQCDSKCNGSTWLLTGNGMTLPFEQISLYANKFVSHHNKCLHHLEIECSHIAGHIVV